MKKNMIRPFDYYALLFFTAAFAGWLWEVLLYMVTAHTFVNRGVYQGPYLPVYGIGSVILILLLHRLRKHPILVFAVSCFLCTTLEYFSGVWLEWKWGVRWWDYSGHLCNINGHICLTSSIGFGLGGVLLICIFQPVFNKYYHRMAIGMRVTLCILFMLIFIA
ncbi:MAG: putative ABC transporter permease, partial [Lachnospiraceae bacterium]|nr:putative ABC transporter permease [Lachnospiraceae bacterium]